MMTWWLVSSQNQIMEFYSCVRGKGLQFVFELFLLSGLIVANSKSSPNFASIIQANLNELTHIHFSMVF